MSFCKKCGAEIPEGSGFCPACGAAAECVCEGTVKDAGAEKEAADLIYSNFGKGIASVVCACIPVASIVAIFLGMSVFKAWKKARALALENGFRLPGKQVANRVTGLVGMIGGIVMTVLYIIYFALIISTLAAVMR